MALFKFRKGADESPPVPAPPPSIEAIRQRAKFRLAGATVLVLIGVVGLPMLFDQQPRPLAPDTPISIPDRNKTAPLVAPGVPLAASRLSPPVPPELQAPVATAAAAATAPPVADKNNITKQVLAPTDKALKATNSEAKPVALSGQSTASTASPASPQAASSPLASSPSDASRAQALLDGKWLDGKAAKPAKPVDTNAVDVKPAAKSAAGQSVDTQPPGTDSRFVVQVGAFADNARAQEVRMKLERAGLKTYTQIAETKDGKRIRVRLGPFLARADAEKAAEKVKKLTLPASLLTL